LDREETAAPLIGISSWSVLDIGRNRLPNAAPRLRLDAGSHGTMGIGMGFAIAAVVVVHPDRPIVTVSGDSAIGFSGMEMETACRYSQPVKIVVLNNGGIGGGIAEFPEDRGQLPPRVLTIGARYDKMMEAFGDQGWYIEDPRDLQGALDEAWPSKGRPWSMPGCTMPPGASRSGSTGTRP
jgi:2-hydroxyacyl-CoA lyase 1